MFILYWIIYALMGVLGLFWLWVATFNGWVAWRRLTRRGERCPSSVPLVGVILAFVLLILWDVKDGFRSHHARALRFLWVPLLLDFGSLSGLAMLFYYFLVHPLGDRLKKWRKRG